MAKESRTAKAERKERGKDRWFQFGMVVLTLLGIFGYVELWIRRQPPVVSYNVTPPEGQLEACPGEPLGYDVRFNVTGPPTIVTVVHSVWDENNRLVVNDVQPFRFAIREEGTVTTPTDPFEVPDLEPGTYMLAVVAHGADRRTTDFGLPFVVPADC